MKRRGVYPPAAPRGPGQAGGSAGVGSAGQAERSMTNSDENQRIVAGAKPVKDGTEQSGAAFFCKMIRRTPRRWSFEKECLRASAVRKGGVGRKPCGSIAAPSCPRSLRRSANASDDISSLHPQRPRTDRTGSPAPGRCAEQVPRQSRRRERKRSPDAFPRRFAPQPLIPLNRRACMEQRFSL